MAACLSVHAIPLPSQPASRLTGVLHKGSAKLPQQFPLRCRMQGLTAMLCAIPGHRRGLCPQHLHAQLLPLMAALCTQIRPSLGVGRGGRPRHAGWLGPEIGCGHPHHALGTSRSATRQICCSAALRSARCGHLWMPAASSATGPLCPAHMRPACNSPVSAPHAPRSRNAISYSQYSCVIRLRRRKRHFNGNSIT